MLTLSNYSPPPRRLITYNFHSGKFPDYRFLFVCVFKPCLHYLAWVKFWNSVSFVILPSIIKRHFALRPDLLGHWLYSLSASFLSYLAERCSFSPPYRVLAIIVIFKYSQLLIKFWRAGHTCIRAHACARYGFGNIQSVGAWGGRLPFSPAPRYPVSLHVT